MASRALGRRPGAAAGVGPCPALLLILALLTPGVGAHQLKEALTTVEVNPRTELVEVVHRFYVHDAEHVVGVLAGLSGDILGDENLRIAFARYVAQKFTLADARRAPLALELVGIELDGPFLWIYQEMPAARFADIAYVSQRSMQDVWSDQINQVNVKRSDGVRSLYLRAGDGLLALPAAATDEDARPS